MPSQVLIDYAQNMYGNVNSAATITVSGVLYNPYDFLGAPFNYVFDGAKEEAGAGSRAILAASSFATGTTYPISMTNTQIEAAIRQSRDLVQKNLDVYKAVLDQINAGTITTTAQIDTTWPSLTSSYVNSRTVLLDLEALAAQIAALGAPVARSFNNTASRSLVSVAAAANGFQPSATRDAIVNYSVTISTTVSLSGNATGYVALEVCSTNSATAANWIEIGRSASGQSGTLVVGLTLTQTGGGQLGGVVPAGYYTRLRTVNTSGTPTYVYNSGQEVLL